PTLRASRKFRHQHPTGLRRDEPRAEIDPREASQLLAKRNARDLDPLRLADERRPRLAEDRLQRLFLRAEVVVQQAVRDARLVGDVADAGRVESLGRKYPHGRLEELGPAIRRSL